MAGPEDLTAALAMKLPRAQPAEREVPKALSAEQYEQLIRAAQAAILDEPLAGPRVRSSEPASTEHTAAGRDKKRNLAALANADV